MNPRAGISFLFSAIGSELLGQSYFVGPKINLQELIDFLRKSALNKSKLLHKKGFPFGSVTNFVVLL